MGVGDKTGGPLSTGTCADCHSGGNFSPSVSMEVLDGNNNPVTDYVPGNNYTVNISVTAGAGAPSGYGFQAVALDGANAQAGTFGTPTTSNSQISNSGSIQYIEHSGASSSGVFSYPWTAPASGTGNVVFYYMGLAVNGMGNTAGDSPTSPGTITLTESATPQACNTPSNLTATGISATSVTLAWQSGGNDTWDLEIVPSGNTPNGGGYFISGIPSYTLTGLQPGTSYDYYVRENCDSVAPLMITGVFDGPLTGGQPKVIELYVNTYIPDLSIYGLGSANNGGGSDGEEFTFPAASATAGSFIYVTSSAADFLTYFGFAADYENSTATAINGDDAVELFMNGNVIDVFGDINTDGTGQPWEYLDGWAYRNNNQINNYGVFDAVNWTYSSPNATDGCSTNSTCASVFPVGTFTNSPNVSAWAGPYTFSTPCLTLTVTTSENVINTCAGSSDGQISLTPSGGVSPYSYTWNTGATTSVLTGLTTGTYTYTVTDFCNNTSTNTITITEITPLTITSSVIDVNCNSESDGAITLAVSGGETPAYLWSNNETTASVVGLTAGNYSVTISDLCENQTLSFTVSEPSALNVSVTKTDNLCANGSDGNASVIVTGGVTPYTYNWSNGETGNLISALPNGVYDITVSDNNNCEAYQSVTITSPAPLTITNIIVNNATSVGGSDGSIDITVTGGTSPYFYTWNNGQTTQDISGLSAGVYTVTVEDNTYCQYIENISVGEPGNCNVVFTSSVMDVSCNGTADGAITVTPVNPSSSPFSYSWSNGGTTNSLNGLSGGVYTLTITDANQCESIADFSVTEPSAITITVSQSNATTPNGSEGSVIVTTAGGTTPYSYSWNNGATTANITGLSEGVYTLTVTDGNNCTETTNVTITAPPCDLAISVTTSDASNSNTSDGSATVFATGSGTPFSYSWSNGATTQSATGLSAGTYSVTVTDVFNCMKTATAIVGAGNVNTVGGFVEDVIVYPNPANDRVTIANLSPESRVVVEDICGKQIYGSCSKTNRLEVDLTNVSKGVYFINIMQNNQTIIFKLIKE